MAVTQQLARVPVEYLAACRRSAATSADGDPHWDPPSADVLDLDWAPPLLQRVGDLAGLDSIRMDALRRATDGDTAVDVGFLDTHPHEIGPFGPTPTALSAAQVADVAELLGRIDISALLAVLPADGRQAGSLIGHGADQIIGGPKEYLTKHFNALREFYFDAARQQLLIVLWCD
ncbi:DUF1877 domain-containing protein [Embleya hyalina]|uniref:DUF1877 domain-containing protein n=1 Tax=Embleya hyalina TaxID=516124 RepID=A0A401Z290_9ACTN|nr:DUF1877 domain-containing protein [Embleya hyalina]GCE01015.1 hypothetical protein EHYA_08754 [Embleya hyalina]